MSEVALANQEGREPVWSGVRFRRARPEGRGRCTCRPWKRTVGFVVVWVWRVERMSWIREREREVPALSPAKIRCAGLMGEWLELGGG